MPLPDPLSLPSAVLASTEFQARMGVHTKTHLPVFEGPYRAVAVVDVRLGEHEFYARAHHAMD